MKWLVIACFLLWARHGEGGALKCISESDAPCSSEQQEIEPQDLDPDTTVSSSVPLEAECLAGSEWESNCHSCRCSVEGVADCRRQIACESPITEPIRCKPNTTFDRQCNTCTCLENGLGLCTLKNCQRIPARVPSKENLPLGQDCAPGSEWKSGCSDCVCSPEGLRLCSSAGCPEDQKTEPLLRCAPHSLWKKECNTCWCTSDGRAMCTKIGCDSIPSDMHFNDEKDEPDSPEVVQPAVKSAPKVNITKKKVCVENRMFIKDCNTCWCNEDGTSYSCTRRVCVPNLPEEPDVEEAKPEKLRIIKRCRPDEVFELDCNMCKCDPDGKSFSCTRRACVDEDIKNDKNETQSRKVRAAPQEPPKTCQPGQEFRMDCNKCLCDNEGQNFSCTRIDCNALNNNNGGTRRKRDVSHKVPADCVPGSVFDQGCNVCRCTEDGGHATCTLKRCPIKEDHKVSTTESSFRCNPGEQFKQSCNDCSCSADGRSVFCTLFICDEDLTP